MNFNFGGNTSNTDKKAFSFGNTSTPASNAPTSMFGTQPSTTPAGPPPSNPGFSFGNINSADNNNNGSQSKSENKPLFGASTGNATSTPASQFSFGTPAAVTSKESSTDTPAGNSKFSFGAAPSTTPFQTPAPANAQNAGPFSFGATGGNDTGKKGGLFGSSVASEPKKSTGGFSFGNTTGQATAAPLVSSKLAKEPLNAGDVAKENEAPASTNTVFSFGNSNTTAKSDAAAVTKTNAESEKPSAGAFAFSAPANQSSDTQSNSSAAKPTGFAFAAAKDQEKPSAPVATTGFSFGAPASSDSKKESLQSTSTFGSRPAAGATTASTITAPPPAPLKNKTMEDIINRWSSDLDKYSQQFQKQASQIAKWDQSLLTSGDQISRLYAATVEVEQHSGKVDQALNYIENQQDELSQLLDTYEDQAREIASEIGVNSPADQEREKAYAQAEKLVVDLDSVGKNLAQMIKELNTSGEVMSRLKEDDPLSTIIKILNSQIQSLNWIDENTTRLNDAVEQLNQMQSSQVPKTPQNKFRFGSLRME